ncbi:MAG: hypothetical protein ABII82_10430 [Verrucomicrobiota bacterium]
MPVARHTSVRPFAALLLCGLLATVAHAQQGGFKIKEINSSAPIKNFRLPTFTAEGWRDMMLKAAEARVINAQRIEVRDMQLTVYTDDIVNQPETTVTSPQAVALPEARRVEGADPCTCGARTLNSPAATGPTTTPRKRFSSAPTPT